MSTPVESATVRGENFLSCLKETSLNIRDLPIRGARLPNSVNIEFLKDGKRVPATGQFFVDLPEHIAQELPGSYISPDTLFDNLEIEDNGHIIKRNILGGDNQGEWILKHQIDGLNINIFSGTTSEDAIKLIKIAARKDAFKESANRLEYQSSLLNIMEPVISFDSKDKPSIRIIEDCLASGDSIMGVLTALYQKTKINEVGVVRIDVAVATAQGILLLKKFAADNNIKMELNIGYVAFGLSKGQKSENGQGLEHANYITHPAEFLDELDSTFGIPAISEEIENAVGIEKNGTHHHKKDIYVVGDMGDAGQSLDEGHDTLIPWNSLRRDKHGLRGASTQINDPTYDEATYPRHIFLANGGYLMRAFLHYVLINRGVKRLEIDQLNEVVFDAKRRFDELTLRYGVLLSHLDDSLII